MVDATHSYNQEYQKRFEPEKDVTYYIYEADFLEDVLETEFDSFEEADNRYNQLVIKGVAVRLIRQDNQTGRQETIKDYKEVG